jgi:hypothetical protein
MTFVQGSSLGLAFVWLNRTFSEESGLVAKAVQRTLLIDDTMPVTAHQLLHAGTAPGTMGIEVFASKEFLWPACGVN